MIWATNEWAVLAVAAVAFAVALEAGHRLGFRSRAQGGIDHAAALQNGLLGLLALLLGFTFAMAIGRYDDRRALVVAEANAVGTLALRVQFLAPGPAAEVRLRLADYVAARLEVQRAGADAGRRAAAVAQTQALAAQIWTQVAAAAAVAPGPLTALAVAAANDVFDAAEERLVALESHVPEAVLALLLVVATVAMGFVGYTQGLEGARRPGPTLTFALLIAVVLTLVLDLDRPGRGLITVSDASLERALADLRR